VSLPGALSRHTLPAIALLVLAAVLAGGCAGAQGGAAAASTRRDFRLPDLDGRQVSLSQFADRKAILLDFWALWCHPCRAELPRLQALYERLEPRGLMLLAINTDEAARATEVRAFVRQRELGFPVLLDSDSRVVNHYNPSLALPFAVRMEGSGKVVKTFEGFQPGEEQQLEQAIEALLGPASGG